MIKPINHKGYKLLHEGAIALSQVEANGMKIDTDYLNKAIKQTSTQIEVISDKLKTHKIYKQWKRRYGSKTNLDSPEQLGKILFVDMKIPCPNRTEKKNLPKTDEETLKSTGLKFVKYYLKMKKLKKARSTYLRGILNETVNGYLHPFFHLHLAQTYRSSSSDPNFQNIPIKNPTIKKLIRRAFIARPNHQIIETDYKGAEICCATCYHKDSTMIKYIKNKSLDLHRDMAMKLLMIPKNQVSWDARDIGKNMFVFPEFYGDFYINCARNMWEAIKSRKIKTVDGISLIKHLKKKGIIELGYCDYNKEPLKNSFEEHVQTVENWFWNKQFKAYGQWKKDWWYEYLDKCYFDTLTGFRIEGKYDRNQVINYPVQGSAFHWLLWSLIQIIKLLKKYKMRSKVIGQIHDSIVADVHKKETKNYLEIVQQVMTIDIRKYWKWIIVPLSVEVEASPVGGNWYEKKEIKI